MRHQGKSSLKTPHFLCIFEPSCFKVSLGNTPKMFEFVVNFDFNTIVSEKLNPILRVAAF